ncbi:MAG TPA: hypothetical protein VFD70_20930 [Anaerolineae bacterium]|nr:hypothetical protein [Anaerolineae bacterium]
MERVSLRQEFHGEPDMQQEGTAAYGKGPDEVTVEVKSGKLKFRVKPEVPDNAVISRDNLEGFLQLILELEDGSELTVNITQGEDDSITDVRLVPAAERGRESEG